MMPLREIGSLLKQTVSDWLDDDAPRLAASLAFYTALSLAPLLVIVISIAGLAFGEEAARGEIVGQIGGLVGTQGAEAVQGILESARDPSSGIIATVIGVVVLLFGASGVFGELQAALNTIWEVKPRPGRGIKGLLKDRFLSFTMVVGVGFLLLVSLVIGAAITAVGSRLGFDEAAILWQAVLFVVSFAVSTLLFALIFKVVPDVRIAWRDVLPGAIATAALFTIGRYLIGLYLGRASVASSYGAAGSLVAVLVWVYYSAQILFLGAELTQAYAARKGVRITPDRDAVPADDPSLAAAAKPSAVKNTEHGGNGVRVPPERNPLLPAALRDASRR